MECHASVPFFIAFAIALGIGMIEACKSPIIEDTECKCPVYDHDNIYADYPFKTQLITLDGTSMDVTLMASTVELRDSNCTAFPECNYGIPTSGDFSLLLVYQAILENNTIVEFKVDETRLPVEQTFTIDILCNKKNQRFSIDGEPVAFAGCAQVRNNYKFDK